MEKLSVIIVDDEISSLQNLQQKFSEFCPDIRVVAVSHQPEEAIRLIRQEQPDAVFLDIEMPRMNGFRMLEEIGEPGFEIIFTTAYNHYAIDAIRISAFDYLTKPIAIRDLQAAVERLMKHRLGKTRERMVNLQHLLGGQKNQEERIAIPTAEGLEFIRIRDIVHIESSSNYSRIHFLEGRSILVTRLLKDFEDILAPYQFYRVHNSHLINLAYIKKYIRGEGGQVLMQNGFLIDVARRKKEDFLKLIRAF